MKSARESRLAEIGSELATKGYFARAQQRARRRKSPWNLLDLLVGFPCMAGVAWVLLRAVLVARNVLVPQDAMSLSAVFQSQRDQVAHIVFFIGALFACFPIGMLISNFIVWSIPPYRRATEPEAKGVWHASFSDAQKDLSLLALCIGGPAILASFVAALVMR
jgi:hypothetical protein